MKFEDEFEKFMENTVNLSPGRLKVLESKSAIIETLLRANAEDFHGLKVVSARPQGSFAQQTIINPKDEQRGFDADLLVEFETEEFVSPKELLLDVRGMLKASPSHKDLVGLRTRCVTLDYKGEFHLDVVPCFRDDYGERIANRVEDQWEVTDPDGFNGWIEQRDGWSNGNLVPVIRLCKFLRDYKGRPAIKSVVLTYLIANQVTSWDSDGLTDLPTSLVILLERLANYAEGHLYAPNLQEPTCAAPLRLDKTDWDAFKTSIRSLANRAREALDDESAETSLGKWRKLFGNKFPAPEGAARVAKSMLEAGEQDLWKDFAIPTDLSGDFELSVEASVLASDTQPAAPFSAYALLPKGRRLSFKITGTNVPGPFDVYWKIKNRGEAAARANQLRGEIIPDSLEVRQRKESTSYTGTHYVEVYVVKDGVCVAQERVDVPIV